jgi:hypothetical protein
MTASAQIAGNTSANIAEVEANTKALRVTLRNEDFGSLGVYSLAGVTGLLTGFTALTDIFSFRWGDATRFALVKRVTISAGVDVTALGAAGNFSFQLFRALSFSGSQTGGTAILPSGSQNKLRTTGMGTTLLTDARIATTAALGAGTKTLDTNPIGAISAATPVTAGTNILAPYPIFDQRPGEHPLLLAQNEGVVLQVSAPSATGSWRVGVKIDWSEVTAY